MKKAEMKIYLESEMKNHLSYINKCKGDKNPQIKEMVDIAQGSFNALDDLYYKLFKKYYSTV